MATIAELEKLARKIVGRKIVVQRGEGAYTDGTSITTLDFDTRWPRLPVCARNDMDRFVCGHEAAHIQVFDRVARKLGKASVSAEEFYQLFADPLSPGVDSQDYVRFLCNVVEDQLVDRISAKEVGQGPYQRTNRFFVWNRQGGSRPSMAELEAGGNSGKCAAFIEALFQIAVFGEIIESFHSAVLESTAKTATKAMVSFGQGSLSRTQALQLVLDALRTYCPPPWKLPEQYQPPRGEGAGSGGDPAASPSSGQAGQPGGKPGEGQGSGDGAPGQGQPGSQGGDAKGEGQGQGQDAQSPGQGKPGDGAEGSPSNSPADEAGNGSEGEGSKANANQASDGDPADAKESDGENEPEPGSESDGGGSSSPSESNNRGTSTGDAPGSPQTVDRSPENRFEDNNLEALLKMLERVLAERAKEAGRGLPRYRTWTPGDVMTSPDEHQRYWEDETFGVDPLKRRCVRQRDRERHLLALFIDSSGSVDNHLFSQLYRVCGELAEKVAELPGCEFGVGQFSGGASWVLEPTSDVAAIQAFAEQTPKRLYNGGTTVGEIYRILPEWFAGYETADLVVMTDGYVEHGRDLAKSLEAAHEATSCEIKVHGVVFRGKGSLKQFKTAKDELPQFVRLWHLGG